MAIALSINKEKKDRERVGALKAPNSAGRARR
jgi:hypothetical protein